MTPFSIFLYLLLIILGLVPVYFILNIYKQYRKRFLLYYLVFVITNNFISFSDMIINYITPSIIKQQNGGNVNLGITFSFIIIPLAIINVYYFISFILEMLDIKFSRLKKRLYFFYWIAFIILYLYSMFEATQSKRYDLPNLLSNIFGFSLITFLLIPLIVALIKLKKHKQSHKKTFYKNIIIQFLFLFTICFIITFFSMKFFGIEFSKFINPMFFLSYNILPIVYIYSYMKKVFPETDNKSLSIGSAKKQYGLSTRETEILHLLIKGKNNKQIEDELFISIRTVETHIYNIFRKTGVNNRLQLINEINKHVNTNIID